MRYKAVVISSEQDYAIASSVYHDIDLIPSIKLIDLDPSHQYLVTCLPCEASFIRHFFAKHAIQVIVVALACSGQQSYDATLKLLEMAKLKLTNVTDLKYRGDGWPSGVQVKTNDGIVHTYPNLKGTWYNIFNSQLFTLDKCFTCTDVLGKNADIVCADPWLPEFMDSKQADSSHTLIFIRNIIPNRLFDNISISPIEADRAILSQKYTINRKEKQLKYISLTRLFLRVRPRLINPLTCNLLVLRLFRIAYSKIWKTLPS